MICENHASVLRLRSVHNKAAFPIKSIAMVCQTLFCVLPRRVDVHDGALIVTEALTGIEALRTTAASGRKNQGGLT
ncbi:MAG: hypothetical protein A2X94_00715 [Bdellovibrionales bacterium GWB1_55_8]|nr:MAG: hypothetical protein A2X94_00715 [Bdellovibrionales bacterium GWB1_55_8]